MIEHVSQETKLQYERTAGEVRRTLLLAGIPLTDRKGRSGAHVYIDTFLDAGSEGGSEGVYVEWLASAELMGKVADCAARQNGDQDPSPHHCRSTGRRVLFIICISGSCGLVIGMAFGISQ